MPCGPGVNYLNAVRALAIAFQGSHITEFSRDPQGSVDGTPRKGCRPRSPAGRG